MKEKNIKDEVKVIVVQRNDLISIAYDLSINEKRLLSWAVATVDSIKDEKFTSTTISHKDFAHIFDIRPPDVHKTYNDVAERLMSKVLKKEEGDTEILFNIFETCKYHKDTKQIEVKFHEEMEEYLLQLKGNFTQYNLLNVQGINSFASWRIYENLKKQQGFTNEFKNLEGYKALDSEFTLTGTELPYWEISLDSFRKLLMLGNKYLVWKDLKKRIIEPSIKEINEKTDVFTNLYYKSTNKSISHLLFVIKEQEAPKINSKAKKLIPSELHLSKEDKEILYSSPSYQKNKSILIENKLDLTDNNHLELAFCSNFDFFSIEYSFFKSLVKKHGLKKLKEVEGAYAKFFNEDAKEIENPKGLLISLLEEKITKKIYTDDELPHFLTVSKATLIDCINKYGIEKVKQIEPIIKYYEITNLDKEYGALFRDALERLVDPTKENYVTQDDWHHNQEDYENRHEKEFKFKEWGVETELAKVTKKLNEYWDQIKEEIDIKIWKYKEKNEFEFITYRNKELADLTENNQLAILHMEAPEWDVLVINNFYKENYSSNNQEMLVDFNTLEQTKQEEEGGLNLEETQDFFKNNKI